MYFKVAVIACLIGLASAGALLNAGHAGYNSHAYGSYDGYTNGGGYGGYNTGYHGAGQLGGAVSHVSITREISPSVPYVAGHGAHGGLGYSSGLGYAAHGLGYNAAGLGHSAYGGHAAQGYNHAISTVNQYSIHTSPIAKHYGGGYGAGYGAGYGSGAYGAQYGAQYGAHGQFGLPTSYSNSYAHHGYDNKAW